MATGKDGDGGRRTLGGAGAAAAILRELGGARKEDLLDKVKQRSPEVGDQIEKRILSFEDIERADARGVRTLMQAIPMPLWTRALRGASPALLARICENMTRRAADQLREELQAGARLPMREVDAARDKIMSTVRGLVAEGKVRLGRDDDEYIP